jgi:pimeloyl-ACP methyl ester carboxylesterase
VADFALVHGAFHGAWCWERVIDALQTRGHRAVAMDLPSNEPGAGAHEYAIAVTKAMSELDEDAIVVGHSFGGLTIPVVASVRAVGRIVFVAAIVPQAGKTMGQVLGANLPTDPSFMSAALDNGDGSSTFRQECVEPLFTHDAPDDTGWVGEKLRRQYWSVANEACPLDTWPDVASEYVLCRHDRVVRPEWQRWAARELLGVVPVELDGGHEPMIARPRDLADVLDQIAVQPPSTKSV